MREKNPMIRFEPGPERCNGYFQISWTPSKIDSKQQLIHACTVFITGTRNEICVSLVYSGNVNEILFPFPLYTRETQISFLVPDLLENKTV
jgi:hypothetical protein